jgi:hypothetical protein
MQEAEWTTETVLTLINSLFYTITATLAESNSVFLLLTLTQYSLTLYSQSLR